ncbi:MAG: GTPase [Candidatus Diapherotrites archaeon]|nr:GTPase [Candidatus Diapherotrites archaeon]MDZ4256686.1 GTPase [archaeon]
MGLAKHAFAAIKEADVVLEVVDARFADIMQNRPLEKELVRRGKIVVLILNKMDLLPKDIPRVTRTFSDDLKIVSISCTPKKNIRLLRTLLFSLLPHGGKIAVVGYPNAGKSCVINALAGRHAAPTSKQAGFTRGRSMIKLKEDTYLLDTPGVIPLAERDEFRLVLVNAKSPNQVKNPQTAAEQLLEWLPTHPHWGTWIQRQYGVDLEGADGYECLENLAVKLNRLRKGGLPDTRAMALKLLLDWQQGAKPIFPGKAN